MSLTAALFALNPTASMTGPTIRTSAHAVNRDETIVAVTAPEDVYTHGHADSVLRSHR